MLEDSPYLLHGRQCAAAEPPPDWVSAEGLGGVRSTKEMMQPCLIYLHAISLGSDDGSDKSIPASVRVRACVCVCVCVSE